MGEIGDKQGSSHCSRCDFEQLEALYQLNIEVKRYAESAEESYSAGRKANARLYSQRKKALYGLKRTILRELVHKACVDAVRTHEIDETAYYCLYVGEFSFHTPTDEWDEPPLDAPTTPSKSLDSFDADPDSRPDHLSEMEALKRLSEQFATPNDYIEIPFIDREYRSEFTGWTSLPGAIEEGDRVDGRFARDVKNPFDEFLFAVGDIFQTGDGKCEIVDRYQAWLTPWLDRSPIMPRTVYDVELDGEVYETVRQRRIVDDWYILADSIQNPVPNVDGKQADIVGNDIEKLVDTQVEFDIGDIIELEPRQEDLEPCYCRVTEAHLSYTLILCDFEPVPPTEEVPLGLSVSEFADDVVAVYDDPPEIE